MILFAASEEEMWHCLPRYAMHINQVNSEVAKANDAYEKLGTIWVCCSCCGFLYDLKADNPYKVRAREERAVNEDVDVVILRLYGQASETKKSEVQ
jgi:hypothetical protein